MTFPLPDLIHVVGAVIAVALLVECGWTYRLWWRRYRTPAPTQPAATRAPFTNVDDQAPFGTGISLHQ
jgi:hypothetical protein